MEIFSHAGTSIHWLVASYANVFLCIGAERISLVDSGPPGREGMILDYVRQLGRQAKDLQQILITHADWDHAGSAAALQAASGATVYAGAESAALMAEGKSPSHMPRPAQYVADRWIRYPAVPTNAIEVVAPGDTLDLLGETVVVAAPGHTFGHLAFYSPSSGVLFAGDALGTRGRLKLTRSFLMADRAAARETARQLLALAPTLFACGHGEPLQGHSNADLLALLQELKQ